MIGWNAFSLFRSLRAFLSLFQFGPCEKVLPPIFREPARSQASSREASALWLMRSIVQTIRCRLLPSGTAERLCCALWLARCWGRGCCAGEDQAGLSGIDAMPE